VIQNVYVFMKEMFNRVDVKINGFLFKHYIMCDYKSICNYIRKFVVRICILSVCERSMIVCE